MTAPARGPNFSLGWARQATPRSAPNRRLFEFLRRDGDASRKQRLETTGLPDVEGRSGNDARWSFGSGEVSGSTDVPASGGTARIGRRQKRLNDAASPRRSRDLAVLITTRRSAEGDRRCGSPLRRGVAETEAGSGGRRLRSPDVSEGGDDDSTGVFTARDGVALFRVRHAAGTPGDGWETVKRLALWSSEHGTGSPSVTYSPDASAATCGRRANPTGRSS